MAKQIINLGTSPNKGDGDPLRTAFDKVNDNFNELYTALGNPSGATNNVLPNLDATIDLGSADKQWSDLYVKDFIYLNGARIEVTAGGALLVNGGAPAEVQDTVGSVFGDDSTLLVDGVNNIIPSANISGTEASNWDTAFLWGDHSAAGYALQATTYTKVEVDAAIAAVDPFSGDVTGSVFADDSTLLVDGVNGKIVGDIKNNLIETNNITALPGDTDIYIQGGIDSGTPGNPARVNIGTTNTSTIVLGAGDAVIYVNGNASSEVAAGTGRFDTITGDLTGSVFADDSNVMVDAVNNTLHASTVNAVGLQSSLLGNGGQNSPLLITSGLQDQTGNTIFINPQGSDTLVQMWGETVNLVTGPYNTYDSPYMQFKTEGAFKAHQGAYFDGNLTGDVTGSVFGDDSTLLVDGVNGVIPTSVLSGDLSTNNLTGTGGGDSLNIYADVVGQVAVTDSSKRIFLTDTDNDLFEIGSGAPFPSYTPTLKVWGDTQVLGTITGNVTGNITGNVTGDVVGSVFADDSTLLVDGAGGTIAGPISSINWMAASDSYLTISNGGSTGPGPIQIVASANLNLSSGTNNDINITPHGSGRVKVSDGAFGIVEAANFIGHADETMYLSSKTTGAESTHITLDSQSGIKTQMYGDVTMQGSFTPPILTQADIDALTPTLGMMVYNTTTGKFQGYAADANNDSTTGWADLH